MAMRIAAAKDVLKQAVQTVQTGSTVLFYALLVVLSGSVFLANVPHAGGNTREFIQVGSSADAVQQPVPATRPAATSDTAAGGNAVAGPPAVSVDPAPAQPPTTTPAPCTATDSSTVCRPVCPVCHGGYHHVCPMSAGTAPQIACAYCAPAMTGTTAYICPE